MDVKEDRRNEESEWYCFFCNTANSEKNTVCDNCGETREHTDEKYYLTMRRERIMAEKDCLIMSTVQKANTSAHTAPVVSPGKKSFRSTLRSAFRCLKKGEGK